MTLSWYSASQADANHPICESMIHFSLVKCCVPSVRLQHLRTNHLPHMSALFFILLISVARVAETRPAGSITYMMLYVMLTAGCTTTMRNAFDLSQATYVTCCTVYSICFETQLNLACLGQGEVIQWLPMCP